MYTTTKDYLTNLENGLSSSERRGISALDHMGGISLEEEHFLLELFLDFLRIYMEPSLEYGNKEQSFFQACASDYENTKGSKLTAWKLFSPMMSINEKRVNPSKQHVLHLLATAVIKAIENEKAGTTRDKLEYFFGLTEDNQCRVLVLTLSVVNLKV